MATSCWRPDVCGRKLIKLLFALLVVGILYAVNHHHLSATHYMQQDQSFSAISNVPFRPIEDDLERFRYQLSADQWPKDKPKAAIYILTHHVTLLSRALRTIDKYFNRQFRYPVILFVEPSFNISLNREHIRSLVSSDVFFQVVEFRIPSFINQSAVGQTRCVGESSYIGYHHMCRFHAKNVYDQAIFEGLEYVWRLDDDSYFTKMIKFDFFQYMRDQGLEYGYVQINRDFAECIVGLWDAAERYSRNQSLMTEDFHGWRMNDEQAIYYTNFEISKLSAWKSSKYQQYIEYIDRLGGIYYTRWGDAPIKTIAVTLFIKNNLTYYFADVGYKHCKDNCKLITSKYGGY